MVRQLVAGPYYMYSCVSPMNFIEEIDRTICRNQLIPDEQALIVGVSGGADSVALLYTLYALGYRPKVAHVNHGLRGIEADADEDFVRSIAETLDLPFYRTKVEIKRVAEETGASIEMAARKERHRFFKTLAPHPTVALAHHADDQVETFLLRIARGAGIEGLSGMDPVQQIGPLRLIRPLLSVSRATILTWLKERGYRWRDDSSNDDIQFKRNTVRHTILPMLEAELNPNIRMALLRTMELLREENKWMTQLASDSTLEKFKTYPLAQQRRMVRSWLFEQGVDDPNYEMVTQLIDLMCNGKGTAILHVDKQRKILVEYGMPRLMQRDQMDAPKWGLQISHSTGWEKDTATGIGKLPAKASLNAQRAGNETFSVRSAEPGDRMCPLGMDGHRKLQDIFTDLKVPAQKRSYIPVVFCGDEIVWIPGFRIAQGWEVPSQTAASIQISLEEIDLN